MWLAPSSYQASAPAQVRHLVDRAMRIAKGDAPRDCTDVPQRPAGGELSEDRRARTARCIPASATASRRWCHAEQDLRHAAEVLNAGKKVAILVGAGALRATDEVIAVAEQLGAGVAKALLGKAVLPDDLPWVTGSIGLLGTKPSWELMSDCDTLLMIGSGFPYSEFLPKEGQARGVQIDIEPEMLSLRYPMEVNLVGDAAETLRALLPMLEEKTDRSWRKRIEKDVAEWWKVLESRAMASANPVNPQRVVWELSPRLPERAIITSDSGSCANWYARDLKIRRGMMCSLSGGLASMGAAVPYAIAAKFAHPDRPVIALVGDGAMQMNNMAELITVAKYWREWSNQKWIVCVFNNQDLNQVTWEQRVMEGDPKFDATQKIPDVPYHRFAELIGLARHLRGQPGQARRRLGSGAGIRSPRGAGGKDRSGDSPASAAYHPEAGEELHVSGPGTRSQRAEHACWRGKGGDEHSAPGQKVMPQVGVLLKQRLRPSAIRAPQRTGRR